LDPVRQSLRKVCYKRRRGREIPLTDAIRRNDLRLGIERNEGVLIANAARIIERCHVALLLADIGPDLVNLDAPTRKLAHLLVHQLRAPVADLDQQPADRVAVRPGHPLSAADRIALDQAVDDLSAAGERYAIHHCLLDPLICTPSVGTFQEKSGFVPTYGGQWVLTSGGNLMKTESIEIRVQPDEKDAFRGAAQLAGIPLSAWIRERLRIAAIRELEGAGLSVPFVRPVPLRSRDAE
jgi:hypothetical protein